MRITHNHPTKTAKAVRVSLVRIDCERWESAEIPEELSQMDFPHPLPEMRSENNSQQHEIVPGPYGKQFDVLMVKNTLEGADVCRAPYETPTDAGFAPYGMPTTRHRIAKSKAAEFRAVDFDGKEEKFKVTIQVTGDDAVRSEKKAWLCITPYSWDHYTDSSIPEPPPPHWEPV